MFNTFYIFGALVVAFSLPVLMIVDFIIDALKGA